MKMGAAPYRAVNGLFSVGVEAIFIAADFSGCGITLTNLRQSVSKDVRVYPARVARTKDVQAT